MHRIFHHTATGLQYTVVHENNFYYILSFKLKFIKTIENLQKCIYVR